jgi:hypothetical protein
MRRALFTALITGILLVPAGAAQAAPSPGVMASCSGHGCDHRDPAAAGCASGTTVADSAQTAYGRVEMRWSAACKTNWLRVPNLPGGVSGLVFDITERATGHYDVYRASTGPGAHWGNMIYAPRCAYGTVVIMGSRGNISVPLASSDC